MTDTTFYLQQVNRIGRGELDLAGLIGAVERINGDGDGGLALALYQHWLLANPQHPLRHVAAFNCGSQMLQAGDVDGALRVLGQIVAEKPDFVPARLNLAAAHERRGDLQANLNELAAVVGALGQVNQTNVGYKVQALKSVARLRRNTEVAEQVLAAAIEIDPLQRELVQHWVNQRQGRCVWPAVTKVGSLSARQVLNALAPLSMAALCDEPLAQLAAAYRYSRQLEGEEGLPTGNWLPPQEAARPAKLKIGYLSSDLCNHAVGYLMLDVFDHHDRERFEIQVFNIGERNNDGIQQKFLGLAERWTDLRGVGDADAAELIRAQGIHVLVDMNGHTNYQRTKLLARRPAPILANWLGYPGSMGSRRHHYIIADDFIVPPLLERFYSERVLRLPCYQPNGKLFEVPQLAASRADLGLPEQGLVYCCFNGSVKITEPVFSRWMRILAAVPGSVIWLRGSDSDPFAATLRREAERRGVAAQRLVLLPFRANTEYLGCHRHADVFLDTFPYTAHTTASDALRMGVPIVTLAGMGFASRVCGSLSRAAGLPDLVCEDPETYVALAIRLGQDAEFLSQIKAKLAAALPSCALFDAAGLVRALEAQFELMWREYASGELPRPLAGHLDFDELAPVAALDAVTEFRASGDYLAALGT